MISRLKKKTGSSTVFLAMVFTAFALCVALTIGVARHMTVMSECEAFGRVWARAILSEYDRYLLEDYGLMAYFGNEAEVCSRLDSYAEYSMIGKLGVRKTECAADLAGFELGDPANFRKALSMGFTAGMAETVLNGNGRHVRENGGNDDAETRIIGNTVVLDTLPSRGMSSSPGMDSIIERAKDLGTSEGIKSAVMNAGTEMAFVIRYFGNNVTAPEQGESWFRNEWEYILKGSPSDEENLRACRSRLFLMRNALDLAALYMDSAKVELITAAAEIITPGPAGVLTQVLIAEAWAALEAEKDLELLFDNKRIPVIKSPEEWQTDLGSVLGSDRVLDELDEEARELMEENSDELSEISDMGKAGKILSEGLSYDDHLLIMLLMMDEETRLLRIMDLVQINMKYRHYRDFNMMEYFVGVRFSITAGGRDHVFEDSYK